MTSFVNMFVLFATSATIKKAVHMFRANFESAPLAAVGSAETAVQVADINKGTFTYDYQSAMSLLVIDFTFLEWREG